MPADFVGPPLFADPPLLAMTTLMLMHLTYFAANIIDRGAVEAAIHGGQHTSFELVMLAVIPSVFGLIIAVRPAQIAAFRCSCDGCFFLIAWMQAIVAVVLPNYAAQDLWFSVDQWKGEMAQYGYDLAIPGMCFVMAPDGD